MTLALLGLYGVVGMLLGLVICLSWQWILSFFGLSLLFVAGGFLLFVGSLLVLAGATGTRRSVFLIAGGVADLAASLMLGISVNKLSESWGCNSIACGVPLIGGAYPVLVLGALVSIGMGLFFRVAKITQSGRDDKSPDVVGPPLD